MGSYLSRLDLGVNSLFPPPPKYPAGRCPHKGWSLRQKKKNVGFNLQPTGKIISFGARSKHVKPILQGVFQQLIYVFIIFQAACQRVCPSLVSSKKGQWAKGGIFDLHGGTAAILERGEIGIITTSSWEIEKLDCTSATSKGSSMMVIGVQYLDVPKD